MNVAYRPLWTVEVRHPFHGGACDELAFIVPPRTRSALAGARALARERDGRLQVLVETSDGQPLAALAGRRFVFGLVPRHAGFAYYTKLPPLAGGEAVLYANDDDPRALDAPRAVELTGHRPLLAPRTTARPCTLQLVEDATASRSTFTLNASEDAVALPGPLQPGAWRLDESTDAGSSTRSLLAEPDLAATMPWGVLALTVHADHLVQGVDFAIELEARSDVLRYYVVGQRYSQSEIDMLSVEDTGFDQDARGKLSFARIPSQDFAEPHLPLAALGDTGEARVVLFEAQSDLPRRARGARGIGLRRGDDLLIDSLPQPGADRPDAQFVVHLRKP